MKISSRRLVTNLIPQMPGVCLDQLEIDGQHLTVRLTSIQPQTNCPECATVTKRIHSSYRRHLADLPWAGLIIRIQLHVRKFFCLLPQCSRRIFTERLPELVAPYARRTSRFAGVLVLLGLALGSRPAARLAERLSMLVSPSSLLRLLRRKRSPEPPEYASCSTPRIIGLDDFAFRKGQRYGTILVDLQTHRPIDVLADRTAETLVAWLRKHPCIEVISRDRSTEYSKAISIGAPQARQIADRFHLVKNLRECLERLIDRNRSHLQDIDLPRQNRSQNRRDSTDRAQAALPPTAARRPAKRSPVEVSARAERRQQRQAVLVQVLQLHKEGMSINSVAQQLRINRQTVYRYLRADTDPTARMVRQKSSMLDPYLPYMYGRWQQGCENGLQLWREVRERGYSGSKKMVSVWVSQQRQRPAKNDPYKNRRPKCAQEHEQDLKQKATRARRQESSRSLSYFLLRTPSSLNAEEQSVLKRIQAASSDLTLGYQLLQEFMDMMRQRSAARLEEWLVKAKTSKLLDFENFAVGIERDKVAVAGGLSEEWSNGQLEGHVNRLKLLKRSMYGRANFDLLRLRVLQVV